MRNSNTGRAVGSALCDEACLPPALPPFFAFVAAAAAAAAAAADDDDEMESVEVGSPSALAAAGKRPAIASRSRSSVKFTKAPHCKYTWRQNKEFETADDVDDERDEEEEKLVDDGDAEEVEGWEGAKRGELTAAADTTSDDDDELVEDEEVEDDDDDDDDAAAAAREAFAATEMLGVAMS